MRGLKAVAGLLVMGVVILPTGGQSPEEVISFPKENLGKLPTGWKIEKTGKGDAGLWKVAADNTAPSKRGVVLAQTSPSIKSIFNLCVLEKGNYKNLEVNAAFKAVKGETDQGGGIVWRFQDANNYYIARMNPLEDNFRLYKVVAGSRKQLATKEGLKVETGTWHSLKIRQVGDKIECYFDGTKYLEQTDKQFDQAGKIGLWTKADAQTNFDQFTVKSLDK